MRRVVAWFGAMALFAGPGPRVQVNTNMGSFVIQTQPDAAPKTVESFMFLVNKGFYNGLIFHRVVKGAGIVQGGGHTPKMATRKMAINIPHEGELAKSKGLLNRRGSVAMATPAGNPFGASGQFFINTKHNPGYDYKSKSWSGYGYCPFGTVVDGMKVVDKIQGLPVKGERPKEDVIIQSVVVLP